MALRDHFPWHLVSNHGQKPCHNIFEWHEKCYKSRSEHIAMNKLSGRFCIIFISRLGKCLYNSVPKLIRDYVALYLHNMLLYRVCILLLFFTIWITIVSLVSFQPSGDNDSKHRWFGKILRPWNLIIIREKLCFEIFFYFMRDGLSLAEPFF